MIYDVAIIGGGVAGVSCALVLGSALEKPFAQDKKVAIFTHQKASSLQNGLYNNAYGIPPGTTGQELMRSSLEHLSTQYPKVTQIADQKILALSKSADGYFIIQSADEIFEARQLVVAVGSASAFVIAGLEDYIIPHPKAKAEKRRIALKNQDHWVADGLYVAGTLAGHRSQLSIAAGSGASVATDIASIWNDNQPTQIHDSVPQSI
ncbi:FAD-dependent oxidoreductase [Flavobacterium sp.]|uniref:FAD-dependent oxidoreductase n=1 Tax=Flavobacterium sp. TaxID=239 RepID=UPI003B9AC7C9